MSQSGGGECAYPSMVWFTCPHIPSGGKCGLSEAVMDLASLTLGQIVESELMFSGGNVTVHLKEGWERDEENKLADLFGDRQRRRDE